MIAKLGYFTFVKNFGITLIIGPIRLGLTKLHNNLKYLPFLLPSATPRACKLAGFCFGKQQEKEEGGLVQS
jgi:hypothetical protein